MRARGSLRRDRCDLVEGHAGGHVRQRTPSRGRRRTPHARRSHPEDLVADRELCDRRADCLDVAGELQARGSCASAEETGEEAADEKLGAAKACAVRLTVVARILTSTSSPLGTGCSTSSSRRTSGGPYRRGQRLSSSSAAVHDQDDVARLLASRRSASPRRPRRARTSGRSRAGTCPPRRAP